MKNLKNARNCRGKYRTKLGELCPSNMTTLLQHETKPRYNKSHLTLLMSAHDEVVYWKTYAGAIKSGVTNHLSYTTATINIMIAYLLATGTQTFTAKSRIKKTQLPGLDRERLVQKLLVEVFLDVVNQDHSHPTFIILWSPCAPHHLQYICDGEIHVPPCLAIIILRAFHNDQVSWEVYAPG